MAKEGQAVALDNEQHNEFLAYLSNTRHYIRDTLIYLLTCRAGLRIGSVAKLKLSDVVDSSGEPKQVITLSKSITKGSKTITAFINHEEVQYALRRYLKVRGNSKLSTLFITQKNTSFSPNSMGQIMLKHYRNAGFEGSSSHSGRAFFASSCLKNGMDIVALSKVMGHSSITTTQRYVRHNQEELMQLVANN